MNTIPKTVKTYTVKCPVCEGMGHVMEYNITPIRIDNYVLRRTCETCKGTGIVEILNR